MAYERADIETMVRQIVTRTLGEATIVAPTVTRGRQRPIIDESAVRNMPAGSEQALPPDALVTPLARQVALERRIRLTTDNPVFSEAVSTSYRAAADDGRTVAIGADHGGYALKEALQQMLQTAEPPYTVIDCGTHSTESVDYPDFAYAVARLVSEGKAWRGIIIDGAGIGSCMAANKVPAVRAAMCYDQATAVNSREHNNANVLTLGAGLIGPNLARQIVQTWLATDFAGGRHARRVEKIDRIGERFAKS